MAICHFSLSASFWLPWVYMNRSVRPSQSGNWLAGGVVWGEWQGLQSWERVCVQGFLFFHFIMTFGLPNSLCLSAQWTWVRIGSPVAAVLTVWLPKLVKDRICCVYTSRQDCFGRLPAWLLEWWSMRLWLMWHNVFSLKMENVTPCMRYKCCFPSLQDRPQTPSVV